MKAPLVSLIDDGLGDTSGFGGCGLAGTTGVGGDGATMGCGAGVNRGSHKKCRGESIQYKGRVVASCLHGQTA